jgi:hypothetical protein
VILGIADNFDPTAIFRDRIALRDSVGCVVGAFGLDVGTNLANDGADVEFGEDYDSVDIGQRGYNFGALFGGHDGPALAFEDADRFVGIDCHYEFSAQSFGSAQITDVADVQQIEIAIGQRNALAGAPPFLYALAKLAAAQDFIVCVQLCACSYVIVTS